MTETPWWDSYSTPENYRYPDEYGHSDASTPKEPGSPLPHLATMVAFLQQRISEPAEENTWPKVYGTEDLSAQQKNFFTKLRISPEESLTSEPVASLFTILNRIDDDASRMAVLRDPSLQDRWYRAYTGVEDQEDLTDTDGELNQMIAFLHQALDEAAPERWPIVRNATDLSRFQREFLEKYDIAPHDALSNDMIAALFDLLNDIDTEEGRVAAILDPSFHENWYLLFLGRTLSPETSPDQEKHTEQIAQEPSPHISPNPPSDPFSWILDEQKSALISAYGEEWQQEFNQQATLLWGDWKSPEYDARAKQVWLANLLPSLLPVVHARKAEELANLQQAAQKNNAEKLKRLKDQSPGSHINMEAHHTKSGTWIFLMGSSNTISNFQVKDTDKIAKGTITLASKPTTFPRHRGVFTINLDEREALVSAVYELDLLVQEILPRYKVLPAENTPKAPSTTPSSMRKPLPTPPGAKSTSAPPPLPTRSRKTQANFDEQNKENLVTLLREDLQSKPKMEIWVYEKKVWIDNREQTQVYLVIGHGHGELPEDPIIIGEIKKTKTNDRRKLGNLLLSLSTVSRRVQVLYPQSTVINYLTELGGKFARTRVETENY